MRLLNSILRIFINKYFIVTVLLLVWLIFFDSNNIISRMKTNQKLKELKKEKRFFQEEIRKDSILTNKLKTDSMALEKFAREKYLMKKDNEDLFLMIDSTEDRHQ